MNRNTKVSGCAVMECKGANVINHNSFMCTTEKKVYGER